jgi:hypothetical protein
MLRLEPRQHCPFLKEVFVSSGEIESDHLKTLRIRFFQPLMLLLESRQKPLKIATGLNPSQLPGKSVGTNAAHNSRTNVHNQKISPGKPVGRQWDRVCTCKRGTFTRKTEAR